MRIARVLCACALTALLGGCVEEVDPSLRRGGGEAGTARAAETAAPAVSTAEVAVTLRDCQVSLGARSVPAGPVTFHLRNEGAAAEELVLRGPEGEWQSGSVPAGATAMLSVTLAAGSYALQCLRPAASGSVQAPAAATLAVH